MNKQRPLVSVILAGLMLWPAGFYAASHREAPITAIDRLADIADFYSSSR